MKSSKHIFSRVLCLNSTAGNLGGTASLRWIQVLQRLGGTTTPVGLLEVGAAVLWLVTVAGPN
jgi:hypothetical protein